MTPSTLTALLAIYSARATPSPDGVGYQLNGPCGARAAVGVDDNGDVDSLAVQLFIAAIARNDYLVASDWNNRQLAN